MTTGPDPADVLWRPPAGSPDHARLGFYLAWLEAVHGLSFDDYDALWHWSVEDLDGFWRSVWDYLGLARLSTTNEPGEVLADATMPGASWFPGTTLNYAEAMLALPGRLDDDVVVVARSQTRGPVELTATTLRDQVARARAGLVRLGVERGDRVAAYAPNVPETLVLLLASASLGAVFASCAPEFGTRSVVDRLAQVEPRVLLAVDGYVHGDRRVDRRPEVEAIRAALPGLEHVLWLGYLDPAAAPPPGTTPWADLLAAPAAPAYDAVPFDHPLYVLYSSGTTGLPKPIVHGHGGITLEHLKSLALHTDLGPDDRFFWFSTTGWMMWNLLVSGLGVGATVVMYDGAPGHPDLGALWRLAEETRTTYVGVSAPYLLACRKAGLVPRELADLSRVRGVGSTGAPLPADGFRWVYDAVGSDLVLSSVSGGTDVCTGFVTGSPTLPVVAGEIACRALGASVEAFDAGGRSVVGEVGELVVTAPMPSMPVGLWGDDDGSAYRAAYFGGDETGVGEGVWRHGDWITITDRGTCTVTGRSDATLNRGGVRLGTSEFYRVVESLPEVDDSLVVHLEDPAGGPGELVLFVVLADRAALDDGLRTTVARALREELSPRHVPDRLEVVPAVPRTLSGKKCEVPVKRILTGADPATAVARGALVDPTALDAFVALSPRSSR